MKHTLLFAFFIFGVGSFAPAGNTDSPAAPTSASSPSFFERETLTGDWFGGGPTLRDHGINLTSCFTQFYGGLLSGDGSKDWEYGGKFDMFLRLDGAKIGLWKGFAISSHFELNYGHARENAGGTILPNNVALMFPGTNGTVADLSLYLSQQFGKHLSLMFGKINMIELYDLSHDFSGGRGVEQFQHLEFTGPMSGIVPPMMFGGIISVQAAPATFTLMIYDPTDQTTRSGLEHPFDEGVTFNGSVGVGSKFFDKPGKHVFTVAYSTKDGLDFNDIPELILPGGLPPGTKGNRWYFAYGFEQAIWQDAADPKKKWGLFGQAAISDGNPNPVEWSILGGFGGTSLFPGRGHDKFGIGFFYLGLSSDLKDAFGPFSPLHDEYGWEFFYNLAVTPWFRVTPDLQVIRPALSNRDTAVIGGLRAQVVF